MALFVHPENQKILWNIINGNPFIIRYFESQPQQEKEMWFKKSIEDFYSKIQGKEINPQELNNINKEALTSMIQSVHLQNPQFSAHNSSIPYQQQTEPQNTMTQHAINTPPVVKDNREEMFNKQFQMRQNEYDSMLQRKVPAEIDFREKQTDGNNQNINELLEREQREREKLMNSLQHSNKIHIDDKPNNIKLEPVDLEEPKSKKSVSWNNESKKDDVKELLEVQKSEMYSMRLHIIDLTKQLEEMNKRISEMENNKKQSNQQFDEKQPHNVTKYSNLEEKSIEKKENNENNEVLVEDVTDSE